MIFKDDRWGWDRSVSGRAPWRCHDSRTWSAGRCGVLWIDLWRCLMPMHAPNRFLTRYRGCYICEYEALMQSLELCTVKTIISVDKCMWMYMYMHSRMLICKFFAKMLSYIHEPLLFNCYMYMCVFLLLYGTLYICIFLQSSVHEQTFVFLLVSSFRGEKNHILFPHSAIFIFHLYQKLLLPL